MAQPRLALPSLLLALALPLALPAQTSPPAEAAPAADPCPAPASSGVRGAGGGELAPGDMVRLRVWRGTEEYGGDLTVAADSTLRHPLYRNVKVAGVPLPEAEHRICRELRRYLAQPVLVLDPLFRVSVEGEVMSPNLLSLPQETTVAQAIALAGGPSDRGQLNRVRIYRGGQVITADLTSPDAEWARQTVRSGDRIVVARRRNVLAEVIGPLASLAAAAAAIATVITR